MFPLTEQDNSRPPNLNTQVMTQIISNELRKLAQVNFTLLCNHILIISLHSARPFKRIYQIAKSQKHAYYNHFEPHNLMFIERHYDLSLLKNYHVMNELTYTQFDTVIVSFLCYMYIYTITAFISFDKHELKIIVIHCFEFPLTNYKNLSTLIN